METLYQDLRYALRLLVKNPGFTAVALLTLALGIAFNTAIFTMVDAALLRPLPYQDPSKLVALFESRQSQVASRFEASFPDFQDWQKQNTAFASLAGYSGAGGILRGPVSSEVVRGAAATANFFRTLGIQPILGRDFRDGEDVASAPPVVLLTYASWQKRFGGKEHIVGQTIVLDDAPTTVIGVLPRDFVFAPRGQAEFWRPLRPQADMLQRRNLHWLNPVARLKPGQSLSSASADLNVVAQRLEHDYPQSNHDLKAVVVPLAEVIVGDVRPILSILLAAVELLLLIACANVANLLLSRSLVRQREIAVRTALGASRWRLIRQLLTEGVILAGCGGLLGLLFGRLLLQVVPRFVPETVLNDMPFLRQIGISPHVVWFVAVSSLVAGLLFSLAPALQISRPDLQQTLKQGVQMTGSRSWRRVSSAFVISEMAISLVLLVGAGLLVETLHKLLTVDTGMNPENLLTMRLPLPDKYSKDPLAIAFHRTVIERVSQLPGVTSVGASDTLPIQGGNTVNSRVVGDPLVNEGHESNIRQVDPTYFSTLQARLLQGRWFTEGDDQSAPLRVIVNRSYVDLYLNGRDPLTHQVVFTFSPTQKPREIVGVVDNVKEGPLDSPAKPAIYEPYNQSPNDFGLVIRTSGSSAEIVTSVQKIVHDLDPEVPVFAVRTMNEIIEDSPSAMLHRYAAWLTMAFAFAALLLGVIGLYSVISHSVTQRTQEIGVRMALGAQRADVLRLVAGQGSMLILIGAAAGLMASLLAGELMRGFLFAVKAWDPIAFAGALLLLALVAAVASCIPAWRATRVNPIQALRYE